MMTGNLSPAIRVRMNGSDWLILLGLSVIWGGSFFFSKIAVAAIPPLTLVFVRVALAALALGVYLLLTHQSAPRGASLWRMLLVMGLINNVIPFTLIFWGQTQIASALASALNATTPLFTVIIAHFLTRDERLNFGKIIGVVLGFCGVVVMIAPRLFEADMGAFLAHALEAGWAGQLACVGAAVSYGFAGNYGRRFASLGVKPLQIAFGQLTSSSVLLLPAVLWVDQPWHLPSPSLVQIICVLMLAFVCTAFAYVIFFRLMARAGATNVSLVTLLVPISAVLLGVMILGERLSSAEMAGMALIGLGLITIDGRLFDKR